MKKKIIYILGVIFIIIIFLLAVFLFIRKYEETKDYYKLLSTSWMRIWDEYYSTKSVNFSGETIPNTIVLFSEDGVKFCTDKQEDSKENVTGEMKCDSYSYSVNKDVITVDYMGEEMIYTFKFNEDGQLLLTYNGDGFEFISCYEASLG